MASTASLQSAMQGILQNCTQTQINELIEALQAAQPRNAEIAAPNAASSMTARAGVTTAKASKKQRDHKKAKTDRATGGPKRPLNSWMAFRKYYSASLAPHTQKTISKVLTSWWREDPFDAKWAMLAKAYSIVRGSREKEEAPLDEFFKIAAPLIAVIPPEEYQARMGWQLGPARADDEEKMPMLARLFVPEFSSFPEIYTTTSLSVDDLVKYCHQVGYATAESSGVQNTNAAGSLTMAVQPTATATAVTRTVNADQDTARMMMMPPLSPSEVHLNQALIDALAAEAPAGETTLQNATTAINGTGNIYPYATTFDPTSQFDISFDPNSFENGGAWDAFDAAMMGNGNDISGIDWNAFVNDDTLA